MSQEKKIVENAVYTIKETTELFYQQKVKEGYAKMEGTIAAILQAVDTLHAYKMEHEAFSLEEERLAASLTEAMQAMEAGDVVLLADVLEYDFVEYIQELLAEME